MCLFVDDGGKILIDFKEGRKNFCLMSGPWKIPNESRKYINHQIAGDFVVPENIDSEAFSKFVTREFL